MKLTIELDSATLKRAKALFGVVDATSILAAARVGISAMVPSYILNTTYSIENAIDLCESGMGPIYMDLSGKVVSIDSGEVLLDLSALDSWGRPLRMGIIDNSLAVIYRDNIIINPGAESIHLKLDSSTYLGASFEAELYMVCTDKTYCIKEDGSIKTNELKDFASSFSQGLIGTESGRLECIRKTYSLKVSDDRITSVCKVGNKIFFSTVKGLFMVDQKDENPVEIKDEKLDSIVEIVSISPFSDKGVLVATRRGNLHCADLSEQNFLSTLPDLIEPSTIVSLGSGNYAAKTGEAVTLFQVV